jgi:hypothetical protein
MNTVSMTDLRLNGIQFGLIYRDDGKDAESTNCLHQLGILM